MAITTLDGLIAGFQPPVFFEKILPAAEALGIVHSLIYAAGIPGQAAAPTSALGGDALTSYPGQIPWSNPASGNGYLAGLSAAATVSGKLMLADRLWHNASITSTTTTAQTINSATLPARDSAGTTNGAGVLVGLEVSTATTNGSAITNTTLNYTNSAGVSGRTATIASFPATAVAGVFVTFQLQAGDVGVRSIQSLTLGTSYGSGVIHLVAYRVVAELVVAQANSGDSMDAIRLGLPEMFDDSVPFLMWQPVNSSSVTVRGTVVYGHG